MVVREKNCYYAIALTDFFVFLSCAESGFMVIAYKVYCFDSRNILNEKIMGNAEFI